MEALWLSSDPEVWRRALEALPTRIAENSKEGYPDLDRWFFEDLPRRLEEESADKSISKEDLVQIVEWKLKRGTWRPKLLDYAKNLGGEEVQSASRQAFATAKGAADKDEAGYIETCGAAMAILTKLKGVGPATASAVLTAGDPNFPYMADEAMDVSLDKQREYTVKRYVEFAAIVRQKAAELSAQGERWHSKDVERALQSEALLHMPPKKRKRAY